MEITGCLKWPHPTHPTRVDCNLQRLAPEGDDTHAGKSGLPKKTYALTQGQLSLIKLRDIGSDTHPPPFISRTYLLLPGTSYTAQHPAYNPQPTHQIMSQGHFPHDIHLDSSVFSTAGLSPQVDNPWNGQAQAAVTGEGYGVGVVPAQYDQRFGQYDRNTFYSHGMFLGLLHR